MVHIYPILNQHDKWVNKVKRNQRVVRLYYLKCVMDYVTNYNLCHVIWVQQRITIDQLSI